MGSFGAHVAPSKPELIGAPSFEHASPEDPRAHETDPVLVVGPQESGP